MCPFRARISRNKVFGNLGQISILRLEADKTAALAGFCMR